MKAGKVKIGVLVRASVGYRKNFLHRIRAAREYAEVGTHGISHPGKYVKLLG